MATCEDTLVKTIRCIVCPTGCVIEVRKAEDGELTFDGYTCKRGLEYAKQEYHEPKRILTSTIRVENGFLPLIPVRTNEPILKDRLDDALKEIAKTIVKAPIKMGDILIENIANLNANLIASRDLIEK